MYQATVYLDGEEIMQDVMLIESVKEGFRLVTLFEPLKVILAKIVKIDLMKHKVVLETTDQGVDNG